MAIVRKDKMSAGYHDGLESVVIVNGATPAVAVEATNGLFVTVENEFYKSSDFFEGEALIAHLAGVAEVEEEVMLVDGKHYEYDEKIKKDDFEYKAGEVARAYKLTDGDIITLTEDLLVDVPAGLGEVFAVTSNGKLGRVAVDATPSAKISFVVIENSGNELTQRDNAWAFRVVR